MMNDDSTLAINNIATISKLVTNKPATHSFSASALDINSLEHSTSIEHYQSIKRSLHLMISDKCNTITMTVTNQHYL